MSVTSNLQSIPLLNELETINDRYTRYSIFIESFTGLMVEMKLSDDVISAIFDNLRNLHYRTCNEFKCLKCAKKYTCPTEMLDEPCCICLENLSGTLLQLPCLHFFHSNCLISWAKDNPSCPICRYAC